jgi:PIN domain nuclease of toxin-antitoxin system
VLLLDTCVLIYDALTPERLSKRATAELDRGRAAGTLACSDISLWEIAMLASRGRIAVPGEIKNLLNDMVLANRLTILSITPEIAALSADEAVFAHKDPADRIIAATAMTNKVPLVTCDALLQGVRGLKTIW